MKFFGYVKNTIITLLEIFCLLLISMITIVAIFLKKMTINALVEKMEPILTPEDLNLMPEEVTPLKQIKQEVLDYLAAEQILTSTPIILALSVLLMLALLALNLRSRLILVLTLLFTAAAIWVSVEVLNEIIKLSEFNQLRLRKDYDTVEDVTVEDVTDWYFLQVYTSHILYGL